MTDTTTMLELTVRQWADEPDRRVRLDVPVDIPLSQLLDDFVDAAEEHAYQFKLEFEDSDGWRLQLPDGTSPNGQCLAQLGITQLALYDALRAPPPFAANAAPGPFRTSGRERDREDRHDAGPPDALAGDEAGTRFLRQTPQPRLKRREQRRHHDDTERAAQHDLEQRAGPPALGAPRSRGRGRSGQRVVRARAEAALPRRMGTPARALQALSALSSSYEAIEARDLGVDDPARFTRARRQPAVRRVREAWWSTDYQRLLEAMILLAAPPACQTIAVLSPKGGVGKTTITGLLGMLLSFVRRTVTIAVDANPDMSNLSAVLSPGRGKLIDELLEGSLAEARPTPMQVLAELGNGPHGLRVAPSPNDPARALDKRSYLLLYERLKTVAEVLVLDCGTGLFDDPAQAALQTADQLVVVVDGAPDTMAMVASRGCQALLRKFDGPSFLVVNKLTRRVRRQVNLAEFEAELAFAHGIVEVAYDEKAAARLARFAFDDRPPADWAVRIRELGALIASSWPA